MRRPAILFLCFTLLLSLCIPVFATEENTSDITSTTLITGSGYSSFAFLFDKDIDSYRTSADTASITLENPAGIGSLYLLFDLEYGSYTVTDTATGKQITAGQQGILHDYLDLNAAFGCSPTAVTLDFSSSSVRLSEIFVFSGSNTPSFVQKWQPPLEGNTDILLFATHGDDDQLYFAGLLPLYAKAKGCRVQVVYLTDHRNLTKARTHEMLNGLWSVGVTAYPVFGSFADFRIDDMDATYAEYQDTYGVSREMLQEFVVRQIRRFRPLVAIGHDLNGEYGHGMHRVYADLLTKAVPLVGDPSQFPESADTYGVWQLPKLYLHLYEENPITIDYDTPMEVFDGLSPFQVTQQYGFPCHKTQQWPIFVNWLYGYGREITKASQIKDYNPSQFGLYHSAVGEDVQKNDFLENITTYAEQERLEQERLEQERIEQERLEQERLEQERKEQERLEHERIEQERLEQERLQAEQKKKTVYCILASALCLAIVITLLILWKKRKK